MARTNEQTAGPPGTRAKPVKLGETPPGQVGDTAPVACAERSVLASVRGIAWPVAIALAFAISGTVAVISLQFLDGIGVLFQASYLAACVLAVCAVRRANLFGPVVQPPLILAAVVPGAALLDTGLAQESDSMSQIIAIATPLMHSFPVMAIATVATVAIGAARLALQRPPDGQSSRSRPPARSSPDGPAKDSAKGPAKNSPKAPAKDSTREPAKSPARGPAPAPAKRPAQASARERAPASPRERAREGSAPGPRPPEAPEPGASASRWLRPPGEPGRARTSARGPRPWDAEAGPGMWETEPWDAEAGTERAGDNAAGKQPPVLPFSADPGRRGDPGRGDPGRGGPGRHGRTPPEDL